MLPQTAIAYLVKPRKSQRMMHGVFNCSKFETHHIVRDECIGGGIDDREEILLNAIKIRIFININDLLENLSFFRKVYHAERTKKRMLNFHLHRLTLKFLIFLLFYGIAGFLFEPEFLARFILC